MAYHTAVYLAVFLPAALAVYQLSPKKFRRIVLLSAGYCFFWLISRELVLYLIGTTIFTHYIGIWLGWIKLRYRTEAETVSGEEQAGIRKQYKRKERWILTGGILVLVGILAWLKYYNFFVGNLNVILEISGSPVYFAENDMLLPIGISFYTLQAIGYMADVYWEKVPAEKNLGKLALFLGFFPQIMEGPISMYSQTADALWEGSPLKEDNLSKGSVRILWGLFKKMIIADRLYVLVNTVFEHYEDYSGLVIAAAAVAYTVQLYMEFSGCMDIVIGSGRMFGVTLPENFNQPFASRNAAEFWRRWHMTLGVWFKTYIFYPVSVSSIVKKWNRFGRKHLGKYAAKLGVSAIALFPVWLLNGLWHGPQWNYIFYGMYYFAILLGGIALEPLRSKVLNFLHADEDARYWRIPQILKTWVIIFVGELFFRSNGLLAGFRMFASMFRDFAFEDLWNGTILRLGLDMADYLVIAAGCLVVACVGIIKERKLLGEAGLQTFRTPVRWSLYYGLIFAVIIFGAYGVGYQQVDLIYANF